jgi:CheY-like chemotaxis protein
MPTKILVADDEPDLERLIGQIFRSAIRKGELIFEFAENGFVAIEKLKADSTFDILFTDINMPVMDGLTLLLQIKENNLLQKAVVISAYGDLDNIRTAMNRGAFDFVTKPIDFADLQTTLDKTIREMEILKQGIEARSNLEKALIEKAEAQQEALINLQEKEKLILNQNEMLERQVAERTVEISHQKELIEIKNREILDSIHYAKRLQEAILPPEKLVKQFLPDSFVLYKPKDIISGDFYWINTIDDGEREKVLFAVADCTGHGVAGALMSMLGVSLLNQIVSEKNIYTPSLILDQLHKSVIDALKQTQNDSHDGMDIAIICFDKNKNEIEYAGANRPLWILHSDEIKIFTPDKLPIGGLQIERTQSFLNHNIQLSKNDILYLFTDGYADQFGGDGGKKMMTQKFREVLLSIRDKNLHEQKIYLEKYFDNWKGAKEQIDDMLVAGIRF